MAREIVWNKRPSKNFATELKRISEESFHDAEKVENAVLSAIDNTKKHPERYPADKFKSNNKGNYRAFETHSYRVAYRFSETEIRILRVRHVKQEPKKY